MTDEALALHADPARAFDGTYQLGAEIGAGTFGVVYRGVDERLDKPVAIKVWHARLAEAAPLRERYDAEARTLTALDHPNIVAITDYGIAGEAPYLVMELLEGQTLEERLRAGPLPVTQTQAFMQSVLRGLGYMHMRGVMHRNLKPDNVFLHRLDAESEQLKLLDLAVESLPQPANDNAGVAQTVRSAYEAPEREMGAEPDARGDVFSAGVMMLHMLSGRDPTRELVRAVAESPELLESLLPSALPEVRAFITRALATERGNRFGNADQMLRAMLDLPTPWAQDLPGIVTGQLLLKGGSLRPSSQRAYQVPATDDTVALPAIHQDEMLGSAETAEPAAEEELVLQPIGLLAKLRAHKRLLLIGAGLVSLAAAGGMAAYMASRAPAPEPPQIVDKSKVATKPKATKKAKAPPPPVEEDEEDDDDDDEVTTIIKRAEPEAAQAAGQGAHAAQAKSGKQATPTEPAVAKPPMAAAAASGKAQTETRSSAAADGSQAPVEQTSVAPTAAAESRGAAKAPPPEPLGAQRHIEPDKDEIRNMLALALAPKPRVPAKNPWAIEIPQSLQALRDAIAKGDPGTSGNLRALRRYNASNPQDPYGHLLLAGFYANRGYSLDALDQYDMAYRIDPGSRGAPEMLKHALNMVADGVAEADAVRFIDRVYGREALNTTSLRAARETNAAAVRRLKQLQTRIASKKR